jgi:hypothetical protein
MISLSKFFASGGEIREWKTGLKWLKKRTILCVHWRRNFKNKRCLSRENQIKSKVYVIEHDFLSHIKPPTRQ